MRRALPAAVFLLLWSAGAPAPAQDVTTGLVAHWPMDTVAGTTADVVGGHTFTCVNGPVATAGFIGGAIDLDGTNDHCTAADAAALNFGTGDFTVALWIRPTNTSSVRVINKWDGPAQQGWIMDIHSTAGGAAQVEGFRFMIDSNNAANNAGVDRVDYTASNAGIGSGAWKHLAAVVDRAAGQLRLYVNGAQVGTTQTIPGTLTTVSNTFQVGLGTIPSALGKYFIGDVDDVRLYSRPLTAADLNALVAPPPPVLDAPATPGNGEVTLTWSAVAGAVGYQVYVTADPLQPVTAAGAPVTGTTATITGLTNGTTYCFVVTADNGIAESVYSNVVSATPMPPPPRTNDHTEGFLDDNCACGSSVVSPAAGLAALAALVLLAGRRVFRF